MKLEIFFRRNVLIIALLCSIILFSCNSKKQLKNIEVTQVEVKATEHSDESISSMIAPYKVQLDAKMLAPIAKLSEPLNKAKPSSTLGNFAADALFVEGAKYCNCTVDFAIVNYGGLRIPSLNEGTVKLGDMYELMPFDNIIVIVPVTGEALKQLFIRMAENGGWPISKEASYIIREGNPENILINNEAIDYNKTYNIAMSDYLANGGDKLEFLKPLKQILTGVFYRDGLINYAKSYEANGEMIPVDSTKRVRNAE